MSQSAERKSSTPSSDLFIFSCDEAVRTLNGEITRLRKLEASHRSNSQSETAELTATRIAGLKFAIRVFCRRRKEAQRSLKAPRPVE